jgi:hypothetical protein
MSLALDTFGPVRRLNRQATTIDVFGNSFVAPLRRHHSSFDLLQLTGDSNSKDGKAPTSSRSVDGDVMGVVRRKTFRPRGNSPDSNSRPQSENSEDDKNEFQSIRKFPILGPTRQQAEFYFKQRNKE